MKKCVLVFGLIFSILLSQGSALGNPVQDAKGVQKIKSQVKKYAAKPSKITATNFYSTKVKGVIIKYDDETFTVRNSKTGAETILRYDETSKISRSGMPVAGWIAIAGAGAGAAILIALISKRCSNEGGC